MRRNGSLSMALHVLLHLSEMEHAATSEALGPMMKTNPVVLRRTLAGLRDAGILRSEKGHGGGWSLVRKLEAVTLRDVHAALGVRQLFTIAAREPRPRCVLEQAANRAIGGALSEAEALIEARFAGLTVASLLADARRRGGVKRMPSLARGEVKEKRHA